MNKNIKDFLIDFIIVLRVRLRHYHSLRL